jgi:pimeloyl-ACP methyl ester carboxylesterase
MTPTDAPVLAFEDTGTDHPVPLVLLHAFPLDRSMWRRVRDLLAPEWRLVLVDLPGLGESPLPDDAPSLAVSADGVAAVLDRLGVPRAVLAGVSMGGYVAMEFLRRHRDRLAGLVLIDTKAEADDEAARAGRQLVAEEVLGPAGTAAIAGMPEVLLGETARRTRADLVAEVTSAVATAPPAAVAWSQLAMAQRPDSSEDLRSLAGAVPVGVVVGEEDTLSPVAAAQAMTVAAEATLTVVPRAGHLAAVEEPAAVARACADIMLRVERDD